MKNRPTVAMNSRGMNFKTVITIWNQAMLRRPARLTAAGSHRPTRAIMIDQLVVWPVFQKTST